MKKRLRFELPRTPLKVLRGEPIQEDIQDLYHERFQAPGTSTEEAEADRDENEDATTHMDEADEEDMARYLGGHTDSVDTVNDPPNTPDYPPNATKYAPNTPEDTTNAQEHDTNGSINLEAADVQVAAQVHQLPDSDVTSNDDTTPLLGNMH